jgi:thiol-disulfide isomerase/thioredoxin
LLGLFFFSSSPKYFAQKLPFWNGIKYKDKIQVVHFFATWCKPCMQELPVFDTLIKIYPKEEIEFTFVCMDLKNSNKLRKEISKLNLPGNVYYLEPTEKAIQSINSNWKGVLPASMVYQLNNIQNNLIEGAKNVSFYRKILEK